MLYDRVRLPRVWVETTPVVPYLPIRGRYVSLRLRVAFEPHASTARESWHTVRLAIVNSQLAAIDEPRGRLGVVREGGTDGRWVLADPARRAARRRRSRATSARLMPEFTPRL